MSNDGTICSVVGSRSQSHKNVAATPLRGRRAALNHIRELALHLLEQERATDKAHKGKHRYVQHVAP